MVKVLFYAMELVMTFPKKHLTTRIRCSGYILVFTSHWFFLQVCMKERAIFYVLKPKMHHFPEEVHLRNYNTTFNMEVKYNNKENSLNNKYWLRKLRSYNYNYVKYFSVPVGECQILSTQVYNCLAR